MSNDDNADEDFDAEHAAESKAREEALERLADTERERRKDAEAVATRRGQERDRLKGELAEARRLLVRVDVNIGEAGYCADCDTKEQVAVLLDIEKFLAAPSPVASTDVHTCTRPKCAGWKQMEPDEREGLDEKEFCDFYEASETGLPCPRGQCAADAKWHEECQPAAPPDDIREHRHCRACGRILRDSNVRIADGCPCNSERGINHGLVPKDTCTCTVCDPEQTGSTRCPLPAAPQEQAGHAFVTGALVPELCGHLNSLLESCARWASDQIHTGAKS